MQVTTALPVAAPPLQGFSLRLPGWVVWSLRIVLSALCVWVLYNKLSLAQISGFISGLAARPSAWLWLLAAAALAPANIGLEAAKWWLCTRREISRSAYAYLRHTLLGISLGLAFTHTVGDFGGKTTMAAAPQRLVGLAVLASLAQYLVTYMGGAVALLMLAPRLHLPWLAGAPYLVLLALPALAVACGYIWLHALIPFANRALPRLLGWVSADGLASAQRLALLGVSLARYLLIIAQYMLALYGMGEAVNRPHLVAGLGLILGVRTVVPLFSAAGLLGMRELVAVTALGAVGVSAPAAIAASLFIWIVNIGLPALAGAAWGVTGKARTWKS